MRLWSKGWLKVRVGRFRSFPRFDVRCSVEVQSEMIIKLWNKSFFSTPSSPAFVQNSKHRFQDTSSGHFWFSVIIISPLMVQRQMMRLRMISQKREYAAFISVCRKHWGTHTHHMKMDCCEQSKLMRWALDCDTCCSSRKESDSWVDRISWRTVYYDTRSLKNLLTTKIPRSASFSTFTASMYYKNYTYIVYYSSHLYCCCNLTNSKYTTTVNNSTSTHT